MTQPVIQQLKDNNDTVTMNSKKQQLTQLHTLGIAGSMRHRMKVVITI
ncbi:MAG: hypothetical protein ACJ71R_05405 [Nitrososphaeraceae archaeon]